MATLYWHDYETWGTDPTVDRPSQFAGVRTDEQFNIVGEPLVVYSQPPEDVLPHPEACLVTGIAPQKALAEGLPENEFIARIHAEMTQPGTCSLGYNSLRFDDEVTRYTLYRNFYDPYEREWRNGNSRWDLIDTVRLCYALRPDGIDWPMLDGKPSFRLENLTAANGIAHQGAHDAYVDVAATIELAKRVKQAQPDLYQYAFDRKHKSQVGALIDLKHRKPLLHISSMYSAARSCAALVVPLAMHPHNKNAVIVYDLGHDPRELIALDAETLAERVFTAQADLPEGQERIPLKLIHLNKCPILVTAKIVDADAAKRLQIDREQCEKHWQTLLRYDLREKVQQVMGKNHFAPRQDPERQLYDGFVGDADRAVMAGVRAANAEQLRTTEYAFVDDRLNQMLWRYKARNFPASLSEKEQAQWWEFCRNRLENGDEAVQSIDQVRAKIDQMDQQQHLDKEQKIILQQLRRYTQILESKYQIGPKCRW